MSNIFLAGGLEAKQRSYLGAGDTTADGDRQTAGFAQGAIARVARIIATVGITGTPPAGYGGGLGGISPRDPVTDPGIIVR